MSAVEINKIIAEAKNGNQLAYTQLLNHFWGDIYRFLLAKCSNEHEAEDLTIKTFSKSFEKLEMFDPSYSFKNWILTIASHLYVDFKRLNVINFEDLDIEKEHLLKIPDETLSPEDQLIKEQQLALLLNYIKNLKPHYREIIHLRYFQELSINEIAEHLNESTGNVKVKLMRAKNLLSEMILKAKTELNN